MYGSRIIQVLLEVAAVRVQLQSPWIRVLLHRKAATSRSRRTEALLEMSEPNEHGGLRHGSREPSVRSFSQQCRFTQTTQLGGSQCNIQVPIRRLIKHKIGEQPLTATVSDLSSLLTSSCGICDVTFERVLCTVQGHMTVLFSLR